MHSQNELKLWVNGYVVTLGVREWTCKKDMDFVGTSLRLRHYWGKVRSQVPFLKFQWNDPIHKKERTPRLTLFKRETCYFTSGGHTSSLTIKVRGRKSLSQKFELKSYTGGLIFNVYHRRECRFIPYTD